MNISKITLKHGTELFDKNLCRRIVVDHPGAGSCTYYCDEYEDVYDDEADEVIGETVTRILLTGNELARIAGVRFAIWDGDEDDE